MSTRIARPDSSTRNQSIRARKEGVSAFDGSRAILVLLALFGATALPMVASASSFFDPVAACDPHTRRVIGDADTAPEVDLWHRRLTYRDVCDIERYIRIEVEDGEERPVPHPATLYPNASNIADRCSNIQESPSGLTASNSDLLPNTTPPLDPEEAEQPAAPRCESRDPNEAWDNGFRYAQLSTTAPTNKLFQVVHSDECTPDSDPPCPRLGYPYEPRDPNGYPEEIKGVGWPVCVKEGDASVVYSDPSVTDECKEGFQPVGFCVPSAHHSERLSVGSGKIPGRVQFSFVHNPAECTPCGHDIRSAVDTCKQRCSALMDHVYWNWEKLEWDLTSNEEETPAVGHVMSSPAVGGGVIDERIPFEDNLLLQCQDLCGPPYQTDSPFHDDEEDYHFEPPWLRERGTKGTAESRNHWFYVTFGRWNPSKRVDGWLRSYNNADNKDHSVALRSVNLVNHYCDSLGIDGKAYEECQWSAINPPRLCPDPDAGELDTISYCREIYCEDANGDGFSGTRADCLHRGIPDEIFHDELPGADYSQGFFRVFHRNNSLCEDTCTLGGSESDDKFKNHWCGARGRKLPMHFPDFVASRFKCGPLTASCDLKPSHCNPQKWSAQTKSDHQYDDLIDGDNLAACKETRIVYPTQDTSKPAEALNSTVLAALFYDGHGQSVTQDMVARASFRVQRMQGTEKVDVAQPGCEKDEEDELYYKLWAGYGWLPSCPLAEISLDPHEDHQPNIVSVVFRAENETAEVVHEIEVNVVDSLDP